MRCIIYRKEGHKDTNCSQLHNNRGKGESHRGDPRSKKGGPKGRRCGQNVYRLEEEDLRLRGIKKKKTEIQKYIILLLCDL